MLTLGSLFDGIGGFPLAAVNNGIVPLWASEIEPFPIAVTSTHFPQMLHLGDITKLNGAELPPVDIIAGGSPCQDLSIASGTRAGLAGARSGLFMEQIRITKEMRNADILRGRSGVSVRPRMLLWENVPGAFSSGEPHGEDFRIVLEEIIKICVPDIYVPRPHAGKFQSAGWIRVGDTLSVGWRVISAQHWGVPKEERESSLSQILEDSPHPRYYLSPKACLGILRRAKVRGKPLPKRLEAALLVQAGLSDGEDIDTDIHAYHINQRNEGIDLHGVAGALMATQNMQMQTFVAGFSPGAGSSAGSVGYTEDVAPTLKSADGGNTTPAVLRLYENHGIDSRYKGPLDVVPTLSARAGTGGNNLPLVDDTPLCIAGNVIDRQPQNGGNGSGVSEDLAYTLTATDRHSVFARQRVDVFQEDDVANTQSARQYKDATDLVYDSSKPFAYLIRRLTPLECERLQGFPDGWTDIPGASDSARYKALGNSVAIPCVDYIMHGVAAALNGA